MDRSSTPPLDGAAAMRTTERAALDVLLPAAAGECREFAAAAEAAVSTRMDHSSRIIVREVAVQWPGTKRRWLHAPERMRAPPKQASRKAEIHIDHHLKRCRA